MHRSNHSRTSIAFNLPFCILVMSPRFIPSIYFCLLKQSVIRIIFRLQTHVEYGQWSRVICVLQTTYFGKLMANVASLSGSSVNQVTSLEWIFNNFCSNTIHNEFQHHYQSLYDSLHYIITPEVSIVGSDMCSPRWYPSNVKFDILRIMEGVTHMGLTILTHRYKHR